MKNFKFYMLALGALWAMVGCSSTRYAQHTSDWEDDLYTSHNRQQMVQRQKAEEQAKQQAWDEHLAKIVEQASPQTRSQAEAKGFESVLADDYESAYQRRLKGFESPSYKMPSSYQNVRFSQAFQYATAYDPAFYNIMISGDEVWVEPRYVTSMFGTWGGVPYRNVNIYLGFSSFDPWYPYYGYGWGYGWGWHRGWYDPWYGPRYPWYCGSCYVPWWGWGGVGIVRHHNYRYDRYTGHGGYYGYRQNGYRRGSSYNGYRGGGSYNESGNRGSYNRGSYNRGSYNRNDNRNGSYNRGSYNNRGNNNREGYNRNKSNQEYRNNSSYNTNRSSGFGGGGYSSGGGRSGGYNRGR